MKYPWLTREERERVRARIAQPGGLRATIEEARKKKSVLSDEDRKRQAAVNALADKFGFPHPYPDLNDEVRTGEGE